MSLSWVKLHISVLDNADYKRFSPPAQHLYMTLLMLAGKQDRGDFSGRLEAATGPLTMGEIRAHARYSNDTLKGALEQLLKAGFVERDLTGTLVIARFKEKCEPKSTDRVQRFRSRHGNPDETVSKRNKTFHDETDKEEEADRYASLRSAVLARFTWPKTPEGFRELAKPFVEAFANCRDGRKQPPHITEYASVLTIMAGKGLTMEQAWEAFEKAWRLNGEEPLWRAEAKRALAQVSGRPLRPVPARENDRGTDYNAIAEGRQTA